MENLTTSKLLRLPKVMEKTGLSRSSVYDQVKKSRFPAPVRIGERAVAWRESDINKWITNLSLVCEG